MTRSTFLAGRLREVLLNGTWIANTNYKAQLEELNLEQATRKIGTLNTIAALTYHINYYLAGIINVFEGGDLEIRDQYSFDLPPLTSEADWQHLLQTFLSNAGKFVQYVEAIPEPQWDDVFVKEPYGSYARNIEGVIEHCYYHLGQISLIRKMVMAS